ncbi:OmpA family protein [Actinomyces sp.]|uniref:OmpA family protein n=1 Tax=Actinomyces sp. TaxID=29317 RepID=UPI0026DC45F1|nr:OmpA family protein [Actinomyces sp.]MDO4899738.1 OmpA family protein [Actinomyces sp.]
MRTQLTSRHFHKPSRASAACAAAAALALALSSCAGGASRSTGTENPASSPAAAAPGAPASVSATPTGLTGSADSSLAVPGYQVGEIPPIPVFTLPDLSLLTQSTGAFTPDLTKDITSVPGVKVTPARCDEPGVLATGSGTTVLDGNGAMSYSDSSVTITNDGDGAGTYSDPSVTITNNGDGSGTYSDSSVTMSTDGNGAGTYSSPTTTVTVDGTGAGTYSDSSVTISNDGDGSGTYSDSSLTITNQGDGTATVSGVSGTVTVAADPLPPVGKVGSFPAIDAIRPVEACGTLITLEDGVLFDFGSYEIRDDASQTLGSLADVLIKAGAPSLQVHGHTDSISDHGFNQTLSENRAQAVVDALANKGVTASMEAAGYGETRPVASNENDDGSDNPAGRQLNRRVEIFIPAF